jgi:Lysyl oxidase
MRSLRILLITTITLFLIIVPSALSQRTSVGRQFPVYNNGGLPDLAIDPQRFSSQMEIIDRFFDPASCAVQEGAVRDTGYRRILRFDTVVLNSGDGDLVVGDRSDPNNPYAAWFYFATCHGHYHIRDFSVYELLNEDGTVVIAQQKGGFCMEDSFKYDGGKSNGYNCAFQGITSGWGDWYYKQLTGQWIDITGIPEGDYIVRATVNLSHTFAEGENRYPNSVQTSLHIPDPRKKVAFDDSAEIVDH